MNFTISGQLVAIPAEEEGVADETTQFTISVPIIKIIIREDRVSEDEQPAKRRRREKASKKEEESIYFHCPSGRHNHHSDHMPFYVQHWLDHNHTKPYVCFHCWPGLKRVANLRLIPPCSPILHFVVNDYEYKHENKTHCCRYCNIEVGPKYKTSPHFDEVGLCRHRSQSLLSLCIQAVHEHLQPKSGKRGVALHVPSPLRKLLPPELVTAIQFKSHPTTLPL